jgi:hypothetical protein
MKYKGGKNGSGVFQRLICMMPPHRVYIEAFLGSGAILRRKRPADRSYAYELNRQTIWDFAGAVPPERFKAWNINQEWKTPADDLPGCGGTSIGFDHADRADTHALITSTSSRTLKLSLRRLRIFGVCTIPAKRSFIAIRLIPTPSGRPKVRSMNSN